jgi:serine/threonine-protein kinase
MATVHFGRLTGARGFQRMVAIKRLHPTYARDDEFAAQFLDEANLAARIQHTNVVQVLDVVSDANELLLVMEYVDGETLFELERAVIRAGQRIDLGVASAIAIGALQGLHAAHEACDDSGEPLGIVHRDVSPQNIMIDRDGIPRVLDFGVAKAFRRLQVTDGLQIKGKPRYMAPEQARGEDVDRRADLFAMGALLWELIVGKQLFGAEGDAITILTRVLTMKIPAPSSLRSGVPKAVDQLVLLALERDPDKRFQTAREFAVALSEVLPPVAPPAVGEWVGSLAGAVLDARAQTVAEIARHSTRTLALERDANGMPSSVANPAGRTHTPQPSNAGQSTQASLPALSDRGTVQLIDSGSARRSSFSPLGGRRAGVGLALAASVLGVAVGVGIATRPAGGGAAGVPLEESAVRVTSQPVAAEPLAQSAASGGVAAASASAPLGVPSAAPVASVPRSSASIGAAGRPQASARAPSARPNSAQTASPEAPTPRAEPFGDIDFLNRRK